MLRKENLVKPRVIVIVSVLSSLFLYALAVLLLDIEDPEVGYPLAVLVPFVVSLPIALTISRYIKRIRKQNEELVELDNTNKRLFYLLSHDIRSPISSQKAALDLLATGDLDSESGKVMIHELSSKTDDLLNFLNDILAWTRRQQEKEELQLDYFLCLDVIQPLVDLYRPQAKSKSISIELRDASRVVFADKDSYAFVIRNLLHNAIKFTPQGGTIQIYTKKSGDQIHTIIRDSGVGMSSSQISAIKNPTKRHTSLGTDKEVGTGFGLKACMDYIKQNGGKLLIESKVGEGSSFDVILSAV